MAVCFFFARSFHFFYSFRSHPFSFNYIWNAILHNLLFSCADEKYDEPKQKMKFTQKRKRKESKERMIASGSTQSPVIRTKIIIKSSFERVGREANFNTASIRKYRGMAY